jgi:hypothetical protein
MSQHGGNFGSSGNNVPQPSDIRYFLEVDDDRIPVSNHMTLGRHLDNDVLLGGEDVLDYHLRIEMTDRGPRVCLWRKRACGSTAATWRSRWG